MNNSALLGILLLDKPLRLSSNHALQRVKRIFKAKKAGHTGTLDPLATGMLPVCFGAATKFSQYLLNEDKTYLVKGRLGETTTTGDLEGEVVLRRDVPVYTEADIGRVIDLYRGEIQQVPPMYSALKHNGKPLYEYARAGIEIERPARTVTIHQLDLLDFNVGSNEFVLRVKCSKGTYIRSLLYDIGESLGCGAVVTELRRTQVGDFLEQDMVALDHLSELKENDPAALQQFVLPLGSAFKHLPRLVLDSDRLQRLRCGQSVFIDSAAIDLTVARDENGMFHGLVGVQSNGLISVCKLLPAQG
jgi:tRNA pseudouridine55 synthase